MNKIYVKKAKEYQKHLTFIKGDGRRANISHHMQYIEFLFKIKKEHSPEKTTLSLLNKTIMIEFFVITEAVLDAMLCQLTVNTIWGEEVSLEVNKLENAETLLKLAKKYELIDDTVHSELSKLKQTRNKIHIKRPKGKLEWNKYNDKSLNECEQIYKKFFEYLSNTDGFSIDEDFFPWKNIRCTPGSIAVSTGTLQRSNNPFYDHNNQS
jgi:hypothetical protein